MRFCRRVLGVDRSRKAFSMARKAGADTYQVYICMARIELFLNQQTAIAAKVRASASGSCAKCVGHCTRQRCAESVEHARCMLCSLSTAITVYKPACNSFVCTLPVMLSEPLPWDVHSGIH